jgi:hypothetical protein
MNEILLALCFLACLLLPGLLLKRAKPMSRALVTIAGGTALLLLAWLDSSGQTLWPKIIITCVVAYQLYKIAPVLRGAKRS